MVIQEEKHFLLIELRALGKDLAGHLDLRQKGRILSLEQSIQILAEERCPKVAHHNPIRVEHGDHYKITILQQIGTDLVRAD